VTSRPLRHPSRSYHSKSRKGQASLEPERSSICGLLKAAPTLTRSAMPCIFGIGGLWENWKNSNSGEWIRTFAVITTDADELVAEIHDRNR
jgi:putative SOS response-associated peptidase YedK